MSQDKYKLASLLLCISLILSLLPQTVFGEDLQYENGGVEFWTNTADGNAFYGSIKNDLPKLPGNIIPPASKNGYPLNFRLWKQKGLLVYGNYASCADINQFKLGTQPAPGVSVPNAGYYQSTDAKTGVLGRGEWRYHGVDVSGNPFSNMNFINDDSGTRFNERDWIKDPWKSNIIPDPQKSDISIYNQAATGAGIYADQPDTQAYFRGLINNALEPDGVPLKGAANDPEVFRYLNVLSAPTPLVPGQGRMWHSLNGGIWYQTLSVPRSDPLQLPVAAAIRCTNKPADLKLLDPGTGADHHKITLHFEVTMTLEDEEHYKDPIGQAKYYTRRDIDCWTITFNDTEEQDGIATVGNKGIARFSMEVTYGYLRSRSWKVNVKAAGKPTYRNHIEGPWKEARTTVDLEKNEPEPINIGPILDVFNPKPDIPEIAFDGVPFTARDDSDMSLVTGRRVYLDGVPINDAEFFSGGYLFEGDTGVNGRFVAVDVEYDVKGAVLPPDKKIGCREFVYVYPTKPMANFKISSNTWKQNRIIQAEDTSAAGNIQLVVERFPITEYRWSFGGDTEKLRVGADTASRKEFLFKEPGIYSLTMECKNSLGRWSDPYTVEFEILQDVAPAVELNLTDSVTARHETIKAWHYTISSTDGDIIETSGIELWYDSDNDGTCDTLLNTWNGKGEFPVYTADKLGYYKYVVRAKEEFGEPTLNQFITDADKKEKTLEVEFWVDNYRPMSDLYVNIPIQRPSIDVYFMLDANLDTAKKDYMLNNRMNIANWLIGKNIIPNVNIWDMRTYTYGQPAGTSYNTGSSYPPDTVSYSSGGYSGILNRTSVSNNSYSRDEGYYTTKTESRTFSESWDNTVENWGTISPYTNHVSDSSPAPGSYPINEDGYSGSIPRTGTDKIYDSGMIRDGNNWSQTRTFRAYYSGELTKTVQVWVSNIVWYDDYTGYYSGTIYKHVRQPYTDPFRATSDKFVIYISDSTISQPGDVDMVMRKADAKLLLAGTTGIKTQKAHDRYFDVSGKSMEAVVGEILNYIAISSPAAEKFYVLQNEAFTMNMGNLDLENDPIVSQELQYVHDPDHFDNPTGIEPGTVDAYSASTGWTGMVKGRFANTGKYEIFRRIKDRPSSDPNFAMYSYYSGATKVEIFVHRKPVALASLDWNYDPSQRVYLSTWVDMSYDPDHQYSRSDKGVVERKIMYRKTGGEWNYRIPDRLTAGTYELQYYVKDPEGVWSDPFRINFTLNDAPPVQFEANLRALDSRFSLAGIPASEDLEAFELWTRYPYQLKLEMAFYNGAARVSPVKTVNFSSSAGVKDGNDIYWNNVVYPVPETLPDRTYTFRISAVDASNAGIRSDKDFTVSLRTPVNLVPLMPEKVLTESPCELGASTSKYANTVQVTLFKGTAHQTALNMAVSAEGETKTWNASYNVPATVPDGIYTAEFKAATPNGNTEVKTAQFEVESLKITGVTVEGCWNHWRGQTDVFGKMMTDESHRFLSMETVKINVLTSGHADLVEIRFSPELEAMYFTDKYGNEYDYAEYFGKHVNFPGDATFKVDSSLRDNHIYWEYTLPLAPSSVSWEDERLREHYRMTVTACRGSKSVTYEIGDIDITGNVYDLTYIQPIN